MTTFLVHDHILILKILVVIGSNPVRESDFFFVPRSWHADYFISQWLLLLLLLLLLLSLKTILNHVSISETVISENLSDNREIKIHDYAKRQT